MTIADRDDRYEAFVHDPLDDDADDIFDHDPDATDDPPSPEHASATLPLGLEWDGRMPPLEASVRFAERLLAALLCRDMAEVRLLMAETPATRVPQSVRAEVVAFLRDEERRRPGQMGMRAPIQTLLYHRRLMLLLGEEG